MVGTRKPSFYTLVFMAQGRTKRTSSQIKASMLILFLVAPREFKVIIRNPHLLPSKPLDL